MFKNYLEQSVQSEIHWSNGTIDRLNHCVLIWIKIVFQRPELHGFWAIPGFVDEKWKYNELKQGLVQKINTQTTPKPKT